MSVYDSAFYESQRELSMRSARAVLPIVKKLVNPNSVLDVGCGVGPWLAVWEELGITDYLGLDGAYVDKNMLYIPEEKFQEADLSKPLELGRKFDLAISLEVGEHLDDNIADTYIQTITNHCSAAIFSAAAPGQGGTDHVNEQWPSYWVKKFETQGFQALDCLRPVLWENEEVSYYYRQNMILFAKPEFLESNSELQEFALKHNSAFLPLIHPISFNYRVSDLQRYKNATEANKLDVVYTWRWFKNAFTNKIKGKFGSNGN